MSAGEAGGGFLHGLEMNRGIPAGPDVALLQRVCAAEMIAVDVALADRRMAGVKVVADGLHLFDTDGFRQVGMQRADEFAGVVRPVGVEMKALSAGMNAGIRAAAAVGLKRRVEDL